MKLKIIVAVLFVSVWIQNLVADPIHDAVNRNDFSKLKELVDRDKSLVSARDNKQETALSLAVNRGSFEMVSYLVENGAEVNSRNESSNTPLYIAARRGRMEIAKYLVEHDAVVNAHCETGCTPMQAAVMGRKKEIVKYLLDQGANPNALDDNNEPALIKACWSNAELEIFEYLLEAGADISHKSRHNLNCINNLTWNGRPEVVKFLIENGADVNLIENGDGTTALMNGIIFGRESFVDCVLPKVENLNLQDKFNQRTALHWGTIKGNKSIVEKLLLAGADPKVRDINGISAPEYAVKYGLTDLANVFISNGNLEESALKNIPESPLNKKPGKQEAVVVYNGHSGWTVKTQKHILIFDYCQQDALPENAGILNGNIVPEELKGKNVYVFSSHDHSDHFDISTISAWKNGNDKIHYIYGFDTSKSGKYRKKTYDGPAYTFVPEHTQQQVDDMKITTLKANDTGEGFMVEVDGLKIFHAGDHANLNTDVQDDYQKEIDFVSSKAGKADIAFLPVTGCPVRWSADYVMNGFFYVVDHLNPNYVFPMHGADREYIYKNFKKAGQERGYTNIIECAENKGDAFVCTGK